MLNKHTFIALSIALSLCGCSTTKTFTQAELRVDKEHDITVHANDGRTIIFPEGDYKIIDDDGGSIRGKGKLMSDVNLSTNYKEWEGTIAFTEIKSVTDQRTTTFGKVALISGGSAVGLAFAFILALGLAQWH